VLDANTSDVIWECSLVNAMGQIEFYKTSNGVIKTDNIYDPSTHLLTGINTLTGSHTNAVYKQKLEYAYNSKLLLETRSNNLIPLTETFTYDNMNRLTSSQVTGQAAITTAFDNETGNISAKTGIGAYDYSLPQPHAVGTITPAAGHTSTICAEQQDITYTSFNKVKTVTEGDNTLDMGYGADHQRIKTVLKNDGNDVKTKYFIGGTYEKEIINGTTERNLYYISASNGLVAIYEKIGSNIAMHYVYKDNLGSYNVITDASGSIEENLSFDAWGRRRNATDWTFDNMPTSFLFDRGFTGHEHLDEFGLINMNGRMYDPKVGAFLSPDVFANSSSTQGLNRYSYAFNNPLAYVDPSGYLAIGGGAIYSPTGDNSALQLAGYNWFNGMLNNRFTFKYSDASFIGFGSASDPISFSGGAGGTTMTKSNNGAYSFNSQTGIMDEKTEKFYNNINLFKSLGFETYIVYNAGFKLLTGINGNYGGATSAGNELNLYQMDILTGYLNSDQINSTDKNNWNDTYGAIDDIKSGADAFGTIADATAAFTRANASSRIFYTSISGAKRWISTDKVLSTCERIGKYTFYGGIFIDLTLGLTGYQSGAKTVGNIWVSVAAYTAGGIPGIIIGIGYLALDSSGMFDDPTGPYLYYRAPSNSIPDATRVANHYYSPFK